MQISVLPNVFHDTQTLPIKPNLSPGAEKSTETQGLIFDFFRPNTLPKQKNKPAILNFTALPDQKQYQQAISKIQDRVNQDLDLQNTWTNQDLHLRNNYQSVFKAQDNPSAQGTVIMLHGYTAGPWQYKEAADSFFEKGFNVYVPRIPGHGFMDKSGMPTGEKMVDTWNPQEYEQFVEDIYQEAASLGGAVHVIGLSGGAGLALRMAEKHDTIQSVVAMAPYLGPDDRVKPAVAILEGLEQHSFIPVGRLLDLKPYGKNVRLDPDHPMPHTQGSIGNAFASLAVGARVDKVTVPVQYFTTQGDLLSGTATVKNLIRRSGGMQGNGWFHFPAADQVPHAMASPMQNKAEGQSDRLWKMIFDMVEKGQTHTQLPETQ